MGAVSMIIFCLIIGIVHSRNNVDWHEEFTNWKQKYGISYQSYPEELYRYNVFIENSHFIQKWNEVPGRHRVAMNAFGDLTNAEFAKFGTRTTEIHERRFEGVINDNVKKAENNIVDWRKKGVVGPVQNQGDMADVIAIAVSEAVSSCGAIATGSYIACSAEQIHDCATVEETGLGWGYVAKVGGLDSVQKYPCFNTSSGCRSCKPWAVTVKGYKAVPAGNEVALERVVNTTVPTAAIDASQSSFQFYQSGVYYDPNCSSQDLDHDIIIVGYGVDSQAGNYWIVQNSWGTSWGMQGYILMSKDRSNNCGIATDAYYGIGCK